MLQKGCLNAPINTICTEMEHAGRCRDIPGTPKSATQRSFHPLGILMQTTLQYVQLVVGASLHQVMSCKDVTTTQAPAAAHTSHQRLLLLILLVTKSKRALSNFIPHWKINAHHCLSKMKHFACSSALKNLVRSHKIHQANACGKINNQDSTQNKTDSKEMWAIPTLC